VIDARTLDPEDRLCCVLNLGVSSAIREDVNLNATHLVDKFRMQLTRWLPAEPCLLCDQPSDQAMALCRGCTRALPWNRCACPQCARPMPIAVPCAACLKRAPAFDRSIAPLIYAEPVAGLIQGLKYNARFAHARILTELLLQQLDRADLPDLLLPVPLHPSRLRRRGYNQALELARRLGKRLSIPVDASRLQQTRRTQDQIGQSAAARRRNLRGAFSVEGRLDGLHIAIIDDVMTTGATLQELARIARKAGATRIQCWAMARVP